MRIYKFSIAVIYHTDHIRFDALYKSNQFSDLLSQSKNGLV